MAIKEVNEEHKENEEHDAETEERNNADMVNESSDDSYAEDSDDDYEGFAFLHSDVLCSIQDKAGIPRN